MKFSTQVCSRTLLSRTKKTPHFTSFGDARGPQNFLPIKSAHSIERSKVLPAWDFAPSRGPHVHPVREERPAFLEQTGNAKKKTRAPSDPCASFTATFCDATPGGRESVWRSSKASLSASTHKAKIGSVRPINSIARGVWGGGGQEPQFRAALALKHASDEALKTSTKTTKNSPKY
jgi:hypothetical protein